MLAFTENLGPLPGPAVELALDSASRRRPRQRARLSDGREAGIMLPRGTALEPGDALSGPSGELARVTAAPEPLSEARAATPELLARAAYHLGNRHAEVELRPLAVRFPRDSVLEELASGLGLEVSRISAPFMPEGGAYGGGGAVHDHGRGGDCGPHGGGGGVAHGGGEGGRRGGEGGRRGGINGWPRFCGDGGPREAGEVGGAVPGSGFQEGKPDGQGAAGSRDASSALPGTGALLKLLYAASPARPTGSFAWSGGLASYILSGEVKDAESLKAWIGDAVRLTSAACDLPLLLRCFACAARRDAAGFARWNAESLAAKGTRELLMGEMEMGAAVMRMLGARGLLDAFPEGFGRAGAGYVAAYGLMAAALGLGEPDARGVACAFLWGTVENYASCAAKSVPLGQNATQGVLLDLMGDLLPRAAEEAMEVPDWEIGASSPMLAVRSSGHEESPLRMYRS